MSDLFNIGSLIKKFLYSKSFLIKTVYFKSLVIFNRFHLFLMSLNLYQIVLLNLIVIIFLVVFTVLIIYLVIKSAIDNNNEYIISKLNYYTYIFNKENVNVIGLWGEDKLLNLLNKFGLHKDIDFYYQKCFLIKKRQLKPDYAIILDKNNYLIVDVKTPWISYKRYLETKNVEEKNKALKEHSNTIRRHVKELALKNYVEIKESLPFILMFVPIESMILDAVKFDIDLVYFCKSHNVYIVTPNTVFILIDMLKQLLIRGLISKSIIKHKQNISYLEEEFNNMNENIDKLLKIYSNNINELNNFKENLGDNFTSKLKEIKTLINKNN